MPRDSVAAVAVAHVAAAAAHGAVAVAVADTDTDNAAAANDSAAADAGFAASASLQQLAAFDFAVLAGTDIPAAGIPGRNTAADGTPQAAGRDPATMAERATPKLAGTHSGRCANLMSISTISDTI